MKHLGSFADQHLWALVWQSADGEIHCCCHASPTVLGAHFDKLYIDVLSKQVLQLLKMFHLHDTFATAYVKQN